MVHMLSQSSLFGEIKEMLEIRQMTYKTLSIALTRLWNGCD